jgi:quinol monooxygenase YgiN
MKTNIKKLSTFLIFLAASVCNNIVAQPNLPIDTESKLITYTEVVNTPGLTKEQLYDKAFAWLMSYYKNPSDVLREKDRDNGSMLIKARFKIFNQPDKKNDVATPAGDVQYSLKLEFKEGRCRYKLSEINWKQPSYYAIERWQDKNQQSYHAAYDYYLKQTDAQCKKIVTDFAKAITEVKEIKKDDW